MRAVAAKAVRAPNAPTGRGRAVSDVVVIERQPTLRRELSDGELRSSAISFAAIPLQRKELTIGATNDPLEAEADAVAEKVMRMPESKCPTPSSSGPTLQRKCACGGSSKDGGECEECKKKSAGLLQKKTAAGGPGVTHAPAIVHDVLRSPGQPLDSHTRAFFEPRLGFDLSRVRIHADFRAGESARAVQARAFTVGSHIAMQPGEHAPHTSEGRRLLAHELAHVIQQDRLPDIRAQRAPDSSVGTPDVGPQSQSTEFTGPLTDPEWKALAAWQGEGTVNVFPLTDNAEENALIVAAQIFCNRASSMLITGKGDPLLCLVPSVTRADPHVRQLIPQVTARGAIVNWARVPKEERIRYVMQRLINRYGFPQGAAAGLVGNLLSESGLIPNRVEQSSGQTPMRSGDFSGQSKDFTATEIMNRNSATRTGPSAPGVGLAQWTSGSRRAGLFRNTFRGGQAGPAVLFDMDAQIDYLINELQTNFTHVYNFLHAGAPSVDDASDEVVFNFEVPGTLLGPDGRRLPRSDPSVQAEFRRRRGSAHQALTAYQAAQPSAAPGGQTGSSASPQLQPLPIQKKSIGGSTSDPLEVEADAIAQKIVGAGSTSDSASVGNIGKGNRLEKPENGTSKLTEAPAIVHDVLRSPGEAMDGQTRTFMERRMGADFSSVRIHSDSQSAKSARAVNAMAYTVGNHVAFGGGQYKPGSYEGRRLLAHELSHVAQNMGRRNEGAPSGAGSGLSQSGLKGGSTIRRQGGSEKGIWDQIKDKANDVEQSAEDLAAAPLKTLAAKPGPPAIFKNPHCPSNFCQPFTDPVQAAKNLAWAAPLLLAGISVKISPRVVFLWAKYLAGGSSTVENISGSFGGDFTRSERTKLTTEYLIAELHKDVEANYATLLGAQSSVRMDFTSRLSAALSAITTPDDPSGQSMDFNIIKELPGNLAGGIGTDQLTNQIGRRPSPINDDRGAKIFATLAKNPNGTVTVTPEINFTVHDTIDLCPGDCGAGVEQVATIPMSRFEATGLAGDVPFVVNFPGPVEALHPFTVGKPTAAPTAPSVGSKPGR